LTSVFFALLNPDVYAELRLKIFLYWLTAGLTIMSGLHYIYKGMKILQDSDD